MTIIKNVKQNEMQNKIKCNAIKIKCNENKNAWEK